MIPDRFKDEVVIVTGAARGIGASIAERFASEGAKVLLADIDGPGAEAAARALPMATGTSCDVSSEAAVEACVKRALATYGRLDAVVNNAGAMHFNQLSQWSKADWIRLLEIDVIGAALFTREAFRHMGERGGAIVNVASVHAERTTANVAPYAAAKAALLSLTRSTSIEGRDRRIRANAVLPGAIDTAMLWSNPNIKSGAETLAQGDVGLPEDIASAVTYLASSEANFITGAALSVDGGRLAHL